MKDLPAAAGKRAPRMRFSIKRGYLALLVLQAAVIGVCAFGAIRVFYRNNTDLLYNQASTVLDLYTINCENKLSLVEKWSYNILSDQSMQAELEALDSGAAGGYDVYMARQKVERLLTGYLFSIDNAESLCFIAGDDSQIISSYYSQRTPFTPEEIRRLRAHAGPRAGATVWVRSEDGEKLHMLRTIKEVRSMKFRDLGVLVITCPMSAVFSYEFHREYSYNPMVVVSDAEQDMYSSRGPTNAAFLGLAARHGEGESFLDIDHSRYFYTGRSSPHTGWTYTCYISNADMLRSVNLLNSQIMTALVVVLVISLTVSVRFSISITTPIERLSREMDALRSGEYHFPPPDEGKLLAVNEVVALGENFHYMAGEIDHLINDVYRKQIMIQDMQYKILRGQINPHFLNNTLDTINSLAKQRGQGEISLMVQSLSKMLRTALSERDLHTLREERQLLESYIAIQKIRFEERLDFTMEETDDLSGVLIPKLTLQPLVENSISYGLERFARVCAIRISAARFGDDVRIAVTDNGPGMEAGFIERIFTGEIEPNRSGLGVKNIHERIRLAFGEGYGVRFESEPGRGTTAFVTIPYDFGK